MTASASIYAVRHRELGLLYVGKTRYGSGFESEYLYRLPFRLALLASALLLPAGFYGLRLASQNNPGYLPLAAIPITFRVQQACEGWVWLGMEVVNLPLQDIGNKGWIDRKRGE